MWDSSLRNIIISLWKSNINCTPTQSGITQQGCEPCDLHDASRSLLFMFVFNAYNFPYPGKVVKTLPGGSYTDYVCIYITVKTFPEVTYLPLEKQQKSENKN